MKITIELTDIDFKMTDGFAARTNWIDKLGVTKEDWMVKKTQEWVVQQARGGAIMLATKPQRDALVSATRAAITTAATEIALPGKTP